MEPREPTSSVDFDPRPLAALEEELTRRVQARERPFTVASWEFDAARPSRPARPGLAAWGLRGAVAAGLLGAVAGAFALPELAQREAVAPMRVAVARAPLAPPAEAAAAPPEIAPPPPPPPPPDETQAAPSETSTLGPRAAPAAPVRPTQRAPEPRAATPAPQEEARPEVAVATPDRPAAPPRARPSFDCGQPLSLADELVCADAGLAAQDRELGRALRQARDAGVPVARLRRQQARWALARDRAAHAEPWRLPTVYERRIEELRAEADAIEAAQAAAEEPYEP